MTLLGIPELRQSHATNSLLRIPPEMDVPVTKRVMALVDTPAMRRLSKISQLGLVALVYPGATHTRFEHSLGVYRNAQRVLEHLSSDPEFVEVTSEHDARLFLVAALLHDVGHWPICHAIEDMQLDWVPRHEQQSRALIMSSHLASIIDSQWAIDPGEVASLIAPEANDIRWPLLRNLLSGPIDIDKMDYLQRDSLHAGVPYGRNFDVHRLIGSLCVGPQGQQIAITEKGKTAAEMMVFSRYVMFSEVYWHHAVRSATAMLQRLVFSLADRCNPEQWIDASETHFCDHLRLRAGQRSELESLSEGLFGRERRLYKRLLQFNFVENAEAHRALARRPYRDLVSCAERLSERLSHFTAKPLLATDILIDAPPVKLEVQFKLAVKANLGGQFQQLGDVSPLVRALATEQFDDYVKRVRVFIAPERRREITLSTEELTGELLEVAGP